MSKLPIYSVLSTLQKEFEKSSIVILSAAPGAGKTTILPLEFLNQIHGKILLIQPRRMATKNVAERLAFQLGESMNIQIGFQTRYEKKVSPENKIQVITDGLMLRHLLSDPELTNVGMVILDEFHERSLAMDAILQILVETVSILRTDLKFLIMSATMNTQKWSEELGVSAILCEGELFPVETIYKKKPDYLDWESYIKNVFNFARGYSNGNILVFLAGKAELYQWKSILESFFPNEKVLLLHGQLSFAEQQAVIDLDEKSQNLIILSTNVAETSITLKGVEIVIDSGWEKELRYEVRRDESTLIKKRISQASADQRRGRAGRVKSGLCIRLWSSDEVLIPFQEPAILRSDLKTFVLQMSLWGITDSSTLRLVEEIPTGHWSLAVNKLKKWEAISESGMILPYGRVLLDFSMDVFWAHFLCQAQKFGLSDDVVDMVCLLGSGDGLEQGNVILEDNFFEHFTAFSKSNYDGNIKKPNRYHELLNEKKKLLHKLKFDQAKKFDLKLFTRYIMVFFPEQIAKKVRDGVFQSYSGARFSTSNTSELACKNWLWIIRFNGDLKNALIQLGMELDKETVDEEMNFNTQNQYELEWSADGFKGHRKIFWGEMLIRSQQVSANHLEYSPELVVNWSVIENDLIKANENFFNRLYFFSQSRKMNSIWDRNWAISWFKERIFPFWNFSIKLTQSEELEKSWFNSFDRAC
jgi:ATP-dependent helicase HrpB